MISLRNTAESASTVDVLGLPPSERLSFWSEVICANFAPAGNISNVAESDFFARMQRRELGPLRVMRVNTAPLVSERDAQLLRRRPLDCFFLSLLTEGEGRLSQGGRQTVQRAGDLLLYDSARAFKYEFLSVYSGIWLRMPRKFVSCRMANAEAMTARGISLASPLGSVLSRLLTEASTMDFDANSSAAAHVATSIMDLVAAVLETSSGVNPADNARNINSLDIAKEFLTANLEDPELCVDSIVKVIGVSRRSLNRLFAQEGTTPVRWLWNKRLERSRAMLESGPECRVTDVALSCGFSDFSHFSRAFKLEFGMTPRSIRARGL